MSYEEGYHKIVHSNLLKNTRYYHFRAKYAKMIYLKYLNGRILEFGSGLGQNIFLDRDRAEGLEISDFSIDFSQKKGIKVAKSIEKLKSNSFDSVLSVHSLEHLENPSYYLKEFYRILKPSGKLLIVLPDQFKNKPIKNFTSDIGKHFYSWNFNSINELIFHNNFNILLNKFNYAYGFSVFYGLPFKLAVFFLKLSAVIKNKKEMIILAQK